VSSRGHARTALLALAREANGYLILESAALHWGWEVRLAPDSPQVAVPRNRRPPPGVVRRDLPQAVLDGWATTPLSTVVMCAAELPFADGLAVADSALRHRAITEAELRRGVTALSGAARHRAALVARLADGRAANPFESALRACAVEAGLAVVPQFRMSLGTVVVHADLANPLLGIVLEAESWEFHGRRRSDFDRDCERYSQMSAQGWRVLRFTWPEVIRRPAYVVETIRTTADVARSCRC
jgi:very-short-patch-repair endonuclease